MDVVRRDDVPTCGNSDMYGLGIRLGFYLQWLAGALAALLNIRSDIVAVRSCLFAFTLAVFIAIIVQTTRSPTLTSADIFITLLLCFGYFYSLPFKLLMKNTRVVASLEFDALQHMLLLAVSGYKLWFWSTGVMHSKNPYNCKEFGFPFRRHKLDSPNVRAFYLVTDCFVIITVAWMRSRIVYTVGRGMPHNSREKSPKDNNYKLIWIEFSVRVAVSALVIGAVEATISWNNLDGMNEVGTPSQMIPLIIGAAILIHTLYRRFIPGENQLYWAVKHRHTFLAWLFIWLGDSVQIDLVEEHVDRANYTLLGVAVDQRDHGMAKLLLRKGASGFLGKKNKHNLTPLRVAVNNWDLETARVLLDSKANRLIEGDTSDPNYFNPLSVAISQGHEGMVKLLLDHVTDIEHGDSNGDWTPLYTAVHCSKDDPRMVKLLLNRMPPPNPCHRTHRKSKEEDATPPLVGPSPQDLALHKGYKEISKLFPDNSQVDKYSDELIQRDLPITPTLKPQHQHFRKLRMKIRLKRWIQELPNKIPKVD